MRIRVRLIVAIAAIGFVIEARQALAQAANCQPISSLPTTILSSGNYCLTQTLTATGQDAIIIAAPDVVLDLSGFTILCSDACRGGFGSSGVRVDGSLGTKNATVRNGTIRGFRSGVSTGSGSELERRGHIIEGLRLDQNVVGVGVAGRAITVRDNQIFVGTGAGLRRGITADGSGHQIVRNVIVHAGQRGTDQFPFHGIEVISGDVTIEGNKVSILDGLGAGGIGILGVGRSIAVLDNRVTGAAIGISFGDDEGRSGEGVFRDNVVVGATTPYVGGTNAGGNFPP